MSTALSLKEIFSEKGPIAKLLRNYELRPEQLKMSEEIQKLCDGIAPKQHLIVEAGTGVGKSLAYLLPLIYWSVENSQKVVISTYTKTLQEQLTNKDLPFLKQVFKRIVGERESKAGIEFEYALCVGSENYLCLRRLSQTTQHGLFDTKYEEAEIEKIIKWSKETETGLRFELEFEPSDKLWFNVCREPDLCLGRKCDWRLRCFYAKARDRQQKANILVVNHHLFFTNIASGGKILPQYDAVVFDEAHNIEDVASEYLGIEISNTQLKYLFDRIYNPRTGKGVLTRITKFKDEEKNNIIMQLSEIRAAVDNFFERITDEFGSSALIKRIRTPNLFKNTLELPLMGLYSTLKSLIDYISNDEIAHEVSAYADRCLQVQVALKTFIEQKAKDYVYWIEITPRKQTKVTLHACPIDISGILREKVFNETPIVILTSATLSVGSSFEYIKERLGLENPNELLLHSPFDYKSQAMIYLPENLPDPSLDLQEYYAKAIEETKEIIELAGGSGEGDDGGGGTFVLFTSFETLNIAAKFLKEKLPNITILRQGEAPRWQMLENFKEDTKAVLLGAGTFWQGVDVPGRALECVIIFKLPFAVPDNPVAEAKMEYLAQQGKDPFIHYQIPQAIIMLKQGFGRLIRPKSDRGVVAVLDPRIKTRYYGRWFIESLPECKITDDI
ncbi:MAG: helicase C-terminal domain-containing protein, partial [Elusimicrobiota bacterium]|nr:helicase C-terminal domain-containing protein [Elusimicrobiota bacterium]